MATKDFIGFTLDCKALGNLLAQDPTALQEVVAGINEALAGTRQPTTTKLGAANLGGDGDDADWHGLFVSTVKDVQPGSAGLFYRNNSRGGKGDRIQMRLRRQRKSQEARTPGAVLPPEIAQAVAAIQANPDILAALSGQAPAAAPQPQVTAGGVSVDALKAAVAGKL